MKKEYVIGIDIGGNNTELGIVDTKGNIISYDSIKTKEYNGKSVDLYIDDIYNKLLEMATSVGGFENIEGIGVGAPNGNYYTGKIEAAANLPWKEVELVKKFEAKFKLKTVLTNDANAAAGGEMIYGAAKGMNHFIEITLGTGVGSGIVVDGKVVYGHDGFAGELGHICIDRKNGRPCGCGRKGCLETYTSATGMANTAREILQNTEKDSLLRQFNAEKLTSEDVYNAAIAGDEIAIEVFEYTGKILGEAFSDFVAFTTPQAIILFGKPVRAGDLLLKPIKESMEANLLKIWKGKVEVLPSKLNEDNAAILGAAALAWQ